MRERSEDEIRFKAIRIYEETGRFGYAVHEADVRGGKAPASRTQAGPGQAKTQTPEVLSAPGSSLAAYVLRERSLMREPDTFILLRTEHFHFALTHFSLSLTSPSGRKYIAHVVRLGDSSVGAGIRRVTEKGNLSFILILRRTGKTRGMAPRGQGIDSSLQKVRKGRTRTPAFS